MFESLCVCLCLKQGYPRAYSNVIPLYLPVVKCQVSGFKYALAIRNLIIIA